MSGIQSRWKCGACGDVSEWSDGLPERTDIESIFGKLRAFPPQGWATLINTGGLAFDRNREAQSFDICPSCVSRLIKGGFD